MLRTRNLQTVKAAKCVKVHNPECQRNRFLGFLHSHEKQLLAAAMTCRHKKKGLIEKIPGKFCCWQYTNYTINKLWTTFGSRDWIEKDARNASDYI